MTLDIGLATRQLAALRPLAPGLFIPHARSIAGVSAHVTIEESERDEVTSTQHPVEQGAPIADHAFKQPEEVTVRAGWNLQDGDLSAESGIYGWFLNWQASFILFDLVTGKRVHRNMLINSIINVTDSQTEYSLMLNITCREIILTKTQTATVSNQNQADPSVTGSTLDKGEQPLQEAQVGPTNVDYVLDQIIASDPTPPQ
jgi:hypothetical protein